MRPNLIDKLPEKDGKKFHRKNYFSFFYFVNSLFETQKEGLIFSYFVFLPLPFQTYAYFA